MKIQPPLSLRCEYQYEPKGVDTPHPRFRWSIPGTERNVRQDAYRVVVEDDTDKTVWDTGKIESSDNICVYNGDPLSSYASYRFRVSWWNLEGVESSLSEPARFETALLEGDDWSGKWISRKSVETFSSNTVGRDATNSEQFKSAEPALAIYLRREIDLAGKAIKRVKAFVSGLGCYELYVNGGRVGDYRLDPGQTDYHTLALYSSYDITGYITRGANAFGLIVGNGRHIGAYGYGKPRATGVISIEYEDGERFEISTDDTWKTSHGSIRENGFFYGELIDRRVDMSGWSEPGYDDSAWENAEVLNYVPCLASQAMQPARATHELEPERIYETEPGVFVCDFGQNFSGWVRLRAEGPPGTAVRVRFSELLHPDGTLNPGVNRSAESTDTFILSGSGCELFEPHFTYHGFRFAEISGYPGVPTPEDITGIFVHTDLPQVGNLYCANEDVNDIHRIIWWGQLSNYMSMPTDCPQRDERMGWMGDAQLTVEEALYNFDMILAYEKFLDDIAECQKDDGSISDVVPPYWPFYPADPAWGTAYIVILWYLYQFYADTRPLEKHYESVKRYVEYLRSISKDNLLEFGKYGDWCPPASTFPKTTPVSFTSSFFYYHDVLHLSKIAEVLGRNVDAESYADLAVSIKEAFNSRYLENGQYRTITTSPMDKSCSQTSQALPLYLDMVPDDQIEKAFNKLRNSVVKTFDYHMDTGIVGTRYLFDVLTRYGEADTAYTVATRDSYPGFVYMLEQGATTMWERWERLEGEGMNSQNHIMLGSVDAWFYRVLAGLYPGTPGWETICIKPYPPKELEYCKAGVETVRGPVSTSWQRYDDTFILTASLPAGCRGDVYLPVKGDGVVIRETGNDGEETVIWASGKPGARADLLEDPVRLEDYVRVSIGSGYYRFEIAQ